MEKDPLNRCYTPESAIIPVLKVIKSILLARSIQNPSVLEPFVGQHGEIARLLREQGYRVTTSDIDSDAKADYHGDFLESIFRDELIRANDSDLYDLCVTNPPYHPKLFTDFVAACIETSNTTVALLPLRFLEPTKHRRAFLKENPPNGMLVMPRIRFLRPENGQVVPYPGVDNAQYAWMFWGGLHGIEVHVP